MQPSSLLEAFCTNKECRHFKRPFLLEKSNRCPVCDEPAQLPDTKNYQPLLKKYGNAFKKLSYRIGSTPLTKNYDVAEWVGLESLYLKDETENPTGSFKERGSVTAAALHMAQLLFQKKPVTDMILGTVSTGNMAISTAWIIDQLNALSPELKMRSFVVVNCGISKEKLELIQKAAGTTGTTLFMVKGNYAKFHSVVYKQVAKMYSQGRPIFIELTDDIFRLSGYATLFLEIAEQLRQRGDTADYVIVPVASGGLFRVAVKTFEDLFKQKKIGMIPHIVLVQEEGADPIVQAFQKNRNVSTPIQMKKNRVAKAIAVSNSRSGTATLSLLNDGYHLCVSVSPKEIREAKSILERYGFFVEGAGAVSVAAAKKLRRENEIFRDKVVVALLSGKEPTKRALFKQKIYSKKVVSCSLKDLPTQMEKML